MSPSHRRRQADRAARPAVLVGVAAHLPLGLGEHHRRQEGVHVGTDLRLHLGAVLVGDVGGLRVGALDAADPVISAGIKSRSQRIKTLSTEQG